MASIIAEAMSASAMVSAHRAFATRFLRPVGTWPEQPGKPPSKQPRACDHSFPRRRATLAAGRGLLPGRMRIFDRLDDFEPFKVGMPERERLALAGLLVSGAELPGFGPGAEIFLRRPYGVR